MGRDKAWLNIDGQSLLARHIQLVREAGAQEVLISGRANVDYSEFDCRVLQDRLVDAGPLGGIESALTVASSSLLLVLAVDMPKMNAEFLRQLLSCCDEDVGVVPRVGGWIEPLAASYSRAARRVIEELFSVQKQSGSAREVAAVRIKSPSATAFAEKCVERGQAKFVDVAESETQCFANWNLPEQVE
jgi:molybdopterin-guanine dinucleotide biosynthesis protein A